MRESQHNAVVADDRRRLIQPWQDRFRDPALTVLLALEICTICLAVPLAAKGLPTAQVVADTLVLAMIAIVVMLSLRSHAIILILLGLAAIVNAVLRRRAFANGKIPAARPGRHGVEFRLVGVELGDPSCEQRTVGRAHTHEHPALALVIEIEVVLHDTDREIAACLAGRSSWRAK